MFEIKYGDRGEVQLSGRFDAAREAEASAFFDAIPGPQVVDLKGLTYVSSLGLGILLRTQKRLMANGGKGLSLVNVSPHILDVLRFSGFAQIFEIRTDSGP
jgi:anti-sigma B factor antagonist